MLVVTSGSYFNVVNNRCFSMLSV